MTSTYAQPTLGARLLPPELRGDFRYLWSASAVSNVGDGVLLAAGPLLVASITDAPLAVGLAVFVQQLPWLLFSLLSGALVDRVDRRRLVVAVDLCRAVAMGGLAVAVLAGTSPLWLVYGVLFVLGIGETLADNASGALIATTVPKPALGAANARLFPTFTLANQLVGPPVGAFLFTVGRGTPFGVYALTLVAAAVLVSRIASRPVEPDAVSPSAGVRGVGRDVREGIAWLWAHAGIRTLALSIFVMNVTFFGAFATWVLFTRDRLGLNETQFGLMIAVSSVGGFVGPFVYGALNQRVGAVWLLRVGLVIETLTHLVLAVTTNPWVAGTVMLVFGVHAMVWGIVSTTVRQQATPAPLLGRVTSVYLLAAVGGAALGALLGSLVAQAFGLTAPFWTAFTLMVLITALAWKPLGHVRVEAAQVTGTR